MTQNSVNNSASEFTVDPGAATDSYIQYNKSSAAKWRTGNDATDDSYRISQGSALGTNDTIIATTTGQITFPLQYKFLAYVPSNLNNQTGNGTSTTVVFGTEVFDIGGGYNNSTGVFTAPVAGKYLFTVNVLLDAVGAGHTSGELGFITTGFGYYASQCSPAAMRNSGNRVALHASIYVDMAATDTCSILPVVYNSTKTVGYFGGQTYTWFSGCLIN